MQESLFVKGLSGEKSLRGELTVNCAKNAVIKAMAASLLFEDDVLLSDVPDIEDVSRMEELLKALGAGVERKGRNCRITPQKDMSHSIDTGISERLRTSIVLTGPLLSRFGEVSFPHPGGCLIGARPIDFFLEGFTKLGTEVSYEKNQYHLKAKGGKLKGADIFFPSPSHTGTETMIMAAVLADGTTTLRNAAMEPEIVDLANFLNACGAHIKGAGTPTISIVGGTLLHARGRVHRALSDRIETGSFLILGALCADELVIRNCNPSHIEILIELLRRSGVKIEVGEDTIVLRGNKKIKNSELRAVNVKTHEYPGFATDLQAPMTVFLTQVSGESLVFETIFEGRLNYTSDLSRMGANITLWDAHRAEVKGPTPLIGRTLGSPDLRAGLAFVLAGAVAKGNSLINNVYYIDRGYERIEERLKAIGLHITRTARTE
ncbi:UDP-N-acetylglucosamine 1-carboxyvinyltransferase [Candidatus Kaiserbacteria bacterium]|nr:UDP-N-acetylglucosamine 1-carboxyvinyltransferase [Candidatus Kaiserbacteria bacterium]